MIACQVASFVSCARETVHLHDQGDLRLDANVGTVGQHVEAELVQHQQLLRQVVAPGQLGQPRRDAADLVSGDLADVLHVLLPRSEPPLRVESPT